MTDVSEGAMFRALFDTTQDGILIVDSTGRYVEVNESLCRILKAPRERLIGARFEEFMPAELRAAATGAFAALQSTGGFAGEFPMRALDGSIVELDWRSRADFVPGLHFCVAREIGDRLAAERALQESHRRLQLAHEELQVAEEELRQQNDELLTARREIEAERARYSELFTRERAAHAEALEANAAKDRFLATLSHELRTPLSPVLSSASALAADPRLPADVRASLERVKRNVELEARLIDDLLDLTRIARGKLELHREVTDLGELIEQALATCCAEAVAEGRVVVSTDLGAGDHRVWADAPRLSQVLWNLLNNAVKFTAPAGGGASPGRIAVRSWAEGAPEEPWVALEVADDGIGIDPEVLPRIFDGFEQGERTITRRFGGLGLGLAVSQAIAELHGGSLTAASAGPGRGATFTLRIPRGALPARDAAAVPVADAAAPGLRGQTPAKLHLLLVEDHADTAAAMAELLTAAGHRVTVAEGVAAALAAAEAAAVDGPMDLVISDVGLPDGSGLDLMRELGGRHGLAGIALSGYGMEEDVRKSRAAGFRRHLTKPVTFQALAAAIAEAVREGG